MENSAVIDNGGIIYFGDFDYYLYALYPDGSLKWQYKTGDWIWSTPALAEDGTVYVGSYDNKLHAVNPNGTRKWTINTGGSISSSPAISTDGMIYLGNMKNNGEIIAVFSNGTIYWRYQTGYYVVSDPAVDDGGTIYVGSCDSYLYALNQDSTLKWRFKTGDWVKSHPVIAEDGTIYINSFDNYLYALHPNGTMKWKLDDCGNAGSPALGADGMIYTGNQHLYGIYPNGTIKWSIILELGHSSPTLSADGVLYVGVGKSIVAVNASDGTELWRKKLCDSWADSSPIIGSDGTVYIGSTSEGWGYLHAFGPVSSNDPPHTPTITGETNGEAGTRYWYSLTAYDPDRNPISFYIEWGDNTTTGWTLERASEETCWYEHTYKEKGTYTIQAKVRDVLGEESDWGTLVVKMPMTYSYPFLSRLINRFPLIARLLELFNRDTTPAPETHASVFVPETQQYQYDFMRMTYHDYQQRKTMDGAWLEQLSNLN
jgi:outer membrane protein assembly factor BamB